ncbi:MAG: oxygen-dependent coproporphyrinogen oxidase [Pseudomonadota bacterium]
MKLTGAQKETLWSFLSGARDRLAARLETVDGHAVTQLKDWQRPEGGGGTMAVLRGQVVEKAGVNISSVSGPEYPAIEGEHKGKPFSASGISTITHMMNPHAPIAHMNVRMLEVGEKFWIGGGADLTPFIEYPEDTAEFHAAMEAACSVWAPDCHAKFKSWCDEYFYIPHRKSARGVGGIFFDYLEGDFDRCLGFMTAVADAYIDVYPRILERRKNLAWDEGQKEGQLFWRGRYAEFNLAWDRGTRFGLMTGGNTEAIFVSLPPVVKW